MGAYAYSQSVIAVGLMYEAAKGSLAQQPADLENAKDEYLRHLDSGGEPIGEWEDGFKLWDQEDKYRLEQLALDDALDELRVATAVAIYHLWERSIPKPNGTVRRQHTELIADAAQSGAATHPDIDALCFAANYFKHGNDRWRARLLERWPERFCGHSHFGESTENWLRQVRLTDDNIWWFLDLAKASQRPVSSTLLSKNDT